LPVGRGKSLIFFTGRAEDQKGEHLGFEPKATVRRLLRFRSQPRAAQPKKSSDLLIFL
jgi:hypothetical protein